MSRFRKFLENYKKRGKRGSALIMVIGMTTLALTLVTTFVALAYNSMNNTIFNMRYTQAKYTAQSVLESFCSNLGTTEGKGIMENKVIPALDNGSTSYSLYFNTDSVYDNGVSQGDIGSGQLVFTKEDEKYCLATKSTYKGVTATVKAVLGQQSVNTGNTVTEEIEKIYANTVHNSGFTYGAISNLSRTDYAGDLFIKSDIIGDMTYTNQKIIFGTTCRYNHSSCASLGKKIGVTNGDVHHGNLTIQFDNKQPFNSCWGFFQKGVIAKEPGVGSGGSGTVAVNGGIRVENSLSIAGDLYVTGSVDFRDEQGNVGSGKVYVGGIMVVGGSFNCAANGAFPAGSNASSKTLKLYVNGDLDLSQNNATIYADEVYVAGKVIGSVEKINANTLVIGSRSPEELKLAEQKLAMYLGYTTDSKGVKHVGYGRISGTKEYVDMFNRSAPVTGVHTNGFIEDQFFKYSNAPLWYSPDDTTKNSDYTIEQGCSSFKSNQEIYYGMTAGTLNKLATVTERATGVYAITSSGSIDQSYVTKYSSKQNYANLATCKKTLFIDASQKDIHLKLTSSLFLSNTNLAVIGPNKVYIYAEEYKIVANSAYDKTVTKDGSKTTVSRNENIILGQVFDQTGKEVDVWSDGSKAEPLLFITSPYGGPQLADINSPYDFVKNCDDCWSNVYTDDTSPRDSASDWLQPEKKYFGSRAIVEVNAKAKMYAFVYAPLRPIIVSERNDLDGWKAVNTVQTSSSTYDRTKIVGSFAVKEIRGSLIFLDNTTLIPENAEHGSDPKFDGLFLFRNGLDGGAYLMKYVQPDMSKILFNQQQLTTSGSSGTTGGSSGSSTDTIWGIAEFI